MKHLRYGTWILVLALMAPMGGCGDSPKETDNTDVQTSSDTDDPAQDGTDTPDAGDLPDANTSDTVTEDGVTSPDAQTEDAEPPPPECEAADDCPIADVEILCQETACVENTCVLVPVENDTSCDDGNVCSAGGSCEEGVCVGGPDIDCDDNDLCTTDETCENGACIGLNIECDDGDVCTLDTCNPATGCLFVEGSGFGCPGHDEDGDGLLDLEDNCPYAFNPEQLDFNDDGQGDGCASGACLEAPNIDIIKHNSNLESQAFTCIPQCLGDSNNCTPTQCMSDALGITEDCAGCYLTAAFCQAGLCQEECLAGNCSQCMQEKCYPSLKVCAGFGLGAVNNQCPSGFTNMCDGSCWPSGYWAGAAGNNYCNLELNCPDQNNDGGDCSLSCSEGETFDCFGGCASESSLGNGTCDANFNCLAFGHDEDDCEPLGAEECPSDSFSNCMSLCSDYSVLSSALGNGICEIMYNCPAMNFDGGDCAEETICPAGQVSDCAEGCITVNDLIADVGNGSCNESLNCTYWTHDGDDCEPNAEGGGEGGGGTCADDKDALQSHGSQLNQSVNNCFQECGSDPSNVACGAQCLADTAGISLECSECFVLRGMCIMTTCGEACENPQSTSCGTCVDQNCDPAFQECSGFSLASGG